jgi:hypothetical protein
MSWLAQLRWKLFGVRDVVIDRTEATLKFSSEARDDARKLNDVLKSYAEKANPLVSMMGDIYNQREVQNIWRGPPR